jgi:integrase
VVSEKQKGGQMSRPRGTGCVYRRADTGPWWLKYSHNGRAICESSHTTNKTKATILLRDRLREIGNGNFVGKKVERVMVEELAEDFLSEYRANGRKSIGNAAARWLLHLKPFFGVYRAVEIATPMLTRYVESRQQQGAKNASCNRELAALKRMFNLGRANQKVRQVPIFPRLQENNVRIGFLEDAHYRRLIEHCPDLWFRAALELARTYGWRKQEILKMRVSQVDLFQRTLRLEVGSTKNRDGREVSMTDAIYTLLLECVRGKTGEQFVLTRRDGRPVKDFRKTWANICAKAGCPGLLFHDLRRTAARNLRRAGIAEGVIQKIGGWKTRSVFERYAIVDQRDIADAMLKLQASEQKSEAVPQNGYSSATVDSRIVQVAKRQCLN